MGGVVVKTQSPCCQRVNMGRVDLTAKTADVRVAHIVHVDDDDVGRSLGGALGFRPPGLRFGTRRADLALEAVYERVP